jgi:hypothetical protein
MPVPAAGGRPPSQHTFLRASGFVLFVAAVSLGLTYVFCPEIVANARRGADELRLRLAAAADDLGGRIERMWKAEPPAAPAAPSTPPPPPAPTAVAPMPASQTLLLWHDNEAVARRGHVDAGDYTEFSASLKRTMDEDRARLRLIAAEHLRAELDPALNLLPARIPTFADEVFTYATSAGLLLDAIGAVDGAVAPSARPDAVEKAHGAVAGKLVDRYRQVVLSPDVTLGPVRNAIGRAYGALRRDLLSNCDRYDRAFRGFLRSHAAGVEILDNARGWRPDRNWNPEQAGFRSLCHTLRLADGGQYVVDAKVLAELAEPAMVVHELLAELSRPIAEIAVDASVSTAGSQHFLEGFGLPSGWTYYPARTWGLAVTNWAMAWQVLDRMNASDNRGKVETHLREALQGARVAITEKALAALIEFVSLRLDGIESVLAARGDGGRASR